MSRGVVQAQRRVLGLGMGKEDHSGRCLCVAIFSFSLFLSSAATGLMWNIRNVSVGGRSATLEMRVRYQGRWMAPHSVLSLQGFVDVNTAWSLKPRVTNQMEAAKPCVSSRAEHPLPLASCTLRPQTEKRRNSQQSSGVPWTRVVCRFPP